MDIVIGKLAKHCFSSEEGDFHIYRARANGGAWFGVLFNGSEPPKARKTVDVVMFGEWEKHPKFGKQLRLSRVEDYKPMSAQQIRDGDARRAMDKILGEDKPEVEKTLEATFRKMAYEHKKRYPTFAYAESFVEWALSRPLSHQIEIAQSSSSIVTWNRSRRTIAAAGD